ncbi:RNA-binding domain-containing protein [Hypoxylon crocopeplum]|nr:RNA-binding domain-containing protein [Hypoxylon crocopeplum]
MHSLRRAAARAACSSSIAVAVPRQQIASFAMQVSKANMRPAAMVSLSRYFSQTSRVAQDQDEEKAAVEEAIGSVEETDYTTDALPQTPIGSPIFIHNMTFDATEAHIREAFGKYGEILDLHIARDARGLSRGYAFLTYKEKVSADRAVAEGDNSFWHGRRIGVKYKLEKGGGPASREGGRTERHPTAPTNSVYVGNIPYETSDADLNRLFEGLDNLKDVRVAVDRNTGWPRGFAHADFTDVESAMKAVEGLKTATLGGRPLRIDFAQQREQSQGRQGRDNYTGRQSRDGYGGQQR